MKISIIVPVYKVEKYIHKCIDTLLEQTIDDYEIILVDDGSPDNCGKICDEYAQKNANIKVIHQDNQGLSMARNNGIKQARGEYLGFVDSDDYISKDMFKYLYENCKLNNADIGICNHKSVDENYDISEEKNDLENKKDEILSNEEVLRRILFKRYDIDVISCNKIFKKELFNDISYPKGKLFEDYTTIVKIISKAQKIFKTYNCYYYYVQRPGSINSDSFKKDEFNKKTLDLLDAINEIESLIYEQFPNIYDDFIVGCIENKMGVANQMIKSNYKDEEISKKLIKQININKTKIYTNKHLSNKDKYKIILYKYPILYKIVYKLYLKKERKKDEK